MGDASPDRVPSSADVESSKDVKIITEEDVLKLHKLLTSTSSREIYKGLTLLRSKYLQQEDSVKLLLEHGVFKVLLKFLNTTKEDLLNMIVSILGNCCNYVATNSALHDEVMKYDICGKSVNILRKITNENVQKRVCRLIGNLAQSHSIAKELHRHDATLCIVSILKTTSSYDVQHMAIRALRWLWESDKYHADMLKREVVKAVAEFLDSENEELIPVVLRALVVFTQSCSHAAAVQMVGKGDGYVQIVNKIDLPIVNVLIFNLSHSPFARIELTKAQVIPSIISKLRSGKNDSYLLTALCQMCKESMVRASLRATPNGFDTFLSLIKNRSLQRYQRDLLNALVNFIYDQSSLNIMIWCGLIEVLVDKLEEVSISFGEVEHEPTNEVGELAPASPSFGSKSPPVSPPSWSPPRAPSCSPPRLQGYPPGLASPTSLMYSPTCSAPEDSDTETSSNPPASRTSASSISSLSAQAEGPLSEDGCVLEVLAQLSYRNNHLRVSVGALASSTTINTFLRYLATVKYPQNRSNYLKASKTLNSIVVVNYFFNRILDEESILKIHMKLCRPEHSGCSHCERLEQTGKVLLSQISIAAQSGLGEGEMSYRLTIGSTDVKTIVALSIPHVVKSPQLLQSLLFKQKAFQFLIDALSSRIDEAVPSFSGLFHTVGITDPQVPFQACGGCEVGSLRKEADVSLLVDDGSTVLANRESLCHSCPMFEAMFRGGFKEAGQASVKISHISAPALSKLIRVADEYCTCTLSRDPLPVLLEMVAASDRFLLPHLTVNLLSYIMNSRLSSSSAECVYDWGLHTGYQIAASVSVSTNVVKYLFLSNILHSQRVNAVQSIMDSRNKESFLEDISKLVTDGIKTYSKTYFRQRTW